MRPTETTPAMRPLFLGAVLALVLSSGAAPAAAQPTPAPVAAGRVVIADGHVDLGPRFVDGKWTLQIRDDSVRPPVWRALSDVVLQAVGASGTQVPTGDTYAFLGATGNPVWLLPQVQREGILWPGWNTQDPEVATKVSREVTWTLAGVEGPGHFVLFLNGNFGVPEVVFDSAEPMPQESGVEVNTHVHGNWAFSAPGTYLLDIRMSAKLTGGGELADGGTVRVHVGDDDPQAAFGIAATTAVSTTDRPPSPTPVAAPAETRPGAWWIAGGAGAVLALVVLILLVRSRRRTSDVR